MATIVLCGKMLYDQDMIYDRMVVLMSISTHIYVYDQRCCVPVDIVIGIRLKRTCIETSHEEADNILFQQYQGEKVRSISDDTYVNPSSPFVCLPHVYTCFARELVKIARLWIWEQQFRRTRTRQMPTW